MSETPATNASDGAAAPAVPAPAPLRRNRGFMLFWTGQSISLLGDPGELAGAAAHRGRAAARLDLPGSAH